MNTLSRREDSLPTPLSAFSWRRDDLFRPFEQLFDEIVNQVQGRDFKHLRNQAGYPRLDVLTIDGKFVVEVAIPGVSPDEVRVEVEPGKGNEFDVLHISGQMETTREDATYHVRELSRRAFRRSMYLPKNLKGDPEALFKNGLLTLAWEFEGVGKQPSPNKVIPIRTE